MFQKLDDVVLKHKELTEMLMDPEVVSDPKKIMEYNKALNSIDEVVQKYTYYKNRKEEMESLEQSIEELDEKELAKYFREEFDGQQLISITDGLYDKLNEDEMLKKQHEQE